MSDTNNVTDASNQNNTIIETPHLLLRPWQESDAAALYKYASNPKIAHDAGWRVHSDEQYSKTVIRMMLLRPTAFAITLKEGENISAFDAEPIGSISLYTGESISRGRAANEGDLGYWLGAPFQNRGYMTEAVREMIRFSFEKYNLSGLWCSHYAGNAASKAVILKAGFRFHHVSEDSYNPMLEKSFTEIFYYVSKPQRQNMHK